jgi:hypothetical protein
MLLLNTKKMQYYLLAYLHFTRISTLPITFLPLPYGRNGRYHLTATPTIAG